MDIISCRFANHVIGKPSDMTDDECVGLPTRVWRDEHGPWATSFWKPNEAELAALVAGGCINLNLRVGPGQHPVTSMGVLTKESLDG